MRMTNSLLMGNRLRFRVDNDKRRELNKMILFDGWNYD
jgi:hypothetical protein